MTDLSNTELRLELAAAEAEKPRSWKASFIKRDRIAAITQELVKRGAY